MAIDKGKAERIRNAVSDRYGNWDFKKGKFTEKGEKLTKRAVRMIAKRESPDVENLKDKVSDRHNTWDFKRGNFTTKGLKMINKAKGMYHVKEEETMDPVTEGIKNVLDGNLEQMRQNFNQALAQKAVEKIEEKKLEIASNYFGIK